MNGFLNSYCDQIAALEAACSVVLHRIPIEIWSLGGGTALALFHFQHRLSHEIDIFVHDPQYFSFLSPKWFIDHQEVFHSEYLEQADHISLATLVGVKVDIILAPILTDKLPVLRRIGPIACYVDSLEEIIAKKIRYRRGQAKTRDIVDLGIAVSRFPGLLKELVEQNAVTLDELFEWRYTLAELDRDRYLQELDIIAPVAGYLESCSQSIEIIIAGIDSLRPQAKNTDP